MVEKIKNALHASPAKSVDKPSQKKRVILLFLVGLLLITGLSVGAVWWYFNDRALPGVMLANVNVGGKTHSEIRQIAENQIAEINIVFSENGKQAAAKPSALGVTFDVEKSVESVMRAGRTWQEIPKLWQGQTIPLSHVTDFGMALEFAKQNFPDLVTDVKDAELVFNNEIKKYEIKDGTDGRGFDIAAFSKTLNDLALKPANVTIPVTTTAVKPVIQSKGLEPVLEQVNKKVELNIRFLHQGRLMYFVDPEDIADVTTLSQDVDNKTIKISYDLSKIEQFLRQKVGPNIAAPPLDKKVIRNPQTGVEIVIQAGREGKQLSDVEGLANAVLEALQNDQPLEKEVSVTTAPFKTITLAGGGDNWVEVDLSEQRVTLWSGNSQVASFIVSSGVAPWHTPIGEYAIWYKTASQTMTGGSRASGDYYYLPGVTWVSYFYQDYGFHTAYWHNNFGTPMSHGCVNMRQADAKALYDFAPIGTKVIVHA